MRVTCNHFDYVGNAKQSRDRGFNSLQGLMAFSKSFPKTLEGVSYPKWVDVYLSHEEESEVEESTRLENRELMIKCIQDAKEIARSTQLNNYQSDIINMAISLFEKLASHSVYAKERRCKDKFDKKTK